MFELFDVDHDGSIDEKEFFFAMNFLGISKSFTKVGMDEVTIAFQKFDTNGDGLISLEGKLFFGLRVYEIDTQKNGIFTQTLYIFLKR